MHFDDFLWKTQNVPKSLYFGQILLRSGTKSPNGLLISILNFPRFQKSHLENRASSLTFYGGRNMIFLSIFFWVALIWMAVSSALGRKKRQFQIEVKYSGDP